MNDDYVKNYELELLWEQIYELQSKVEQLQLENTLLTNDLNIIKNEGCYRFVEDKNHKHE